MVSIKPYFILLLLITLSNKVNGQKKFPDDLPCTKIISQLSYFWQLDSLANNGFRVYAFPDLLDCVLDTVNCDYLLKNFGNPEIIRDNKETFSYLYYCFRRKNMPLKYKGLFDDIYVSFTFDNKSKNLISVKHDIFN